MNNELKLENFLKKAGLEIKCVKCGNVLGLDSYLIYADKNYNINFLYRKLNIKISKVPKSRGEHGSTFIIKKEDGDKLLQGCGFIFLDALGKDNYQELIKNQLIINGTGKLETKVHFVKGKVVLLYNTLLSSTCIAKSLNICNDSVVDVSTNDCGDLKMIILLDRVGNPWVTELIPKTKICENDFNLKKDALDMPHPLNCIRKQLKKNCIDCGVIDISSDDIIRLGTCAETDDIVAALNIPPKSVVDLVDKKYILLDRVLRKVKDI